MLKAIKARKSVRVAAARSAQYQDLLNASKLLKDTSRREAATAWKSPAATAEPLTAGQTTPPAAASSWATPAASGTTDPAAAWAKTASPAMSAKTRQARAGALMPVAQQQLQSGIGTPTLSHIGPASQPQRTQGSGSLSLQISQEQVAQHTAAGIALVNLRSKGVQFTPGGLYTIVGVGFGNAAGTVELIGTHLPGGRLPLQVTQWNDRQLQAQLAEPMSGIADQDVTLRVTTHDGTLYAKDVQFYATRQPVVLSSSELDLNRLAEMAYGNQNDWTAEAYDGMIMRTKSGDNIACPSIGQDTLRTKLPPGWAVAEVAVSTWLPAQGDPNKDYFGGGGDTVVSGAYNITQIPAGLTNQTYNVNWGVLRSHSTKGFSIGQKFSGNDFGWSGNDGCVSGYEVAMTVVGPAGLRP